MRSALGRFRKDALKRRLTPTRCRPASYNGTMLSTEARSRLAVVLVGARNPQNIGAAARAMQDFGFSDLRVVNEFTPPFEAARLEARSAVGAGHVMRAAQRFDTLADAVADCTLVAGTTAIGGRGLRQPVLPLREAAPEILSALVDANAPMELAPDVEPLSPHDGKTALLFGSEKTGLTNDQLSYCSLLLTVPMFAPEGRHLSMNLGQAVAVCLYELSRGGFAGSRELPFLHAARASEADRARLNTLVLETMQQTGYARRFPANARPEIVRQLVGNLGRSREEAATWMGFLRLVLQAVRARQEDKDTDKE